MRRRARRFTTRSTEQRQSISSTKYTAPFTVSATETVKAIAVATGYTNSVVATAAFSITTVTGIPLSGTVSSGTKPIGWCRCAALCGGYDRLWIGTDGVACGTGADWIERRVRSGYTCPAATSQVYLVATKGSIGGVANNDIALMTALGSCGSLASGAAFTINEVTTVASVYALAAFSKPARAEASILALLYRAPTVSAQSRSPATTWGWPTPSRRWQPCEYRNGCGAHHNAVLRCRSGGEPEHKHGTAGAYQHAGRHRCELRGGGGKLPSLFTSATPPASHAGPAPVDSLQAAMNIAQNPGTNVAALYTLIPSTPGLYAEVE